MWTGSDRNDYSRTNASEPQNRQKAMVLRALVADLSFWGDLNSFQEGKGDNHAESLTSAVTNAMMPMEQALQSSETRTAVTVTTAATASVTLNAGSATASAASSNNNSIPIWKTAVDAQSGKTYYYDMVSRRTQWEKPAQIREMERQQRREQKQQDVLFFREMERNILMSLKRGQRIPCCDSVPQLARHQSATTTTTTTTTAAPATAALPRSRTLSGMDEVLLQQFSNPAPLKQPQPHGNHNTASKPRDAHGRPPLNPVSMGRASIATTTATSTATAKNGASLLPIDFAEMSLEFSPELVERKHPLTRDDSGESELRGVALLDGPLEDDDALCDVVEDGPKNQLQHQHVRRNTGGTIYMKTTMMNPDIKATIKCVCGVYRAHILQASSKRSGKSPVSVALTHNQSLANVFLDDSPGNEIPSLDEVVCFYQDFYVRSQMEHDTIIMSLIYVERLIKEDTSISPLPENWRSVLFSCMVLASKVWDDLSMWNIDFSNVCGRGGGLTSYTLSRINELELALLKALNFNVKVPASEYAKYYFLIRSMLFKSGLLLPADRPMNCQQHIEKSSHRSSKSMDDYGFVLLDQTVCLEQLLSQTTY